MVLPQGKKSGNKALSLNHNDDSIMDTKCHLFATSHGRSGFDRIGRTTKRIARKEYLQKPL
jgi:hypothetical protein